ncbi:MAG: hypothetical protein HJJLKODD_01733 [Phycisphaerae bacterium]|nr:hypothetical protein [Phycisphaerae bacterium]
MVRIAEVRSRPHGSVGCSSDPNSRCGNGLEEIYPTSVVRYGYLKHIGEFTYSPGMKFTCGARVMIQTSRGVEIGQQVSLTCTGCSKSVSRDQMRSYAEASGEGFLDLNSGSIIREATLDDLNEDRHIREQALLKKKRCQELARHHLLPMKVVECEHLFGGERLIFYFMSDNRIDFRDLVKDLAREYHTRIEMRQIGARDEARLVADYETCGQECCCKTFLKTLKPISMKMAKQQKATLDPSKVSGRCGRLKCCLRYEHETYEELDSKLPRLGLIIRTSHGEGVVVDRQILTQLIQIETADQRRLTVVVEDIQEILGPAGRADREDQPDQDERVEQLQDDAPPRHLSDRDNGSAGEGGEMMDKEQEGDRADDGPRRRRRRSRRSREGGGPAAPESSAPPPPAGEAPDVTSEGEG